MPVVQERTPGDGAPQKDKSGESAAGIRLQGGCNYTEKPLSGIVEGGDSQTRNGEFSMNAEMIMPIMAIFFLAALFILNIMAGFRVQKKLAIYYEQRKQGFLDFYERTGTPDWIHFRKINEMNPRWFNQLIHVAGRYAFIQKVGIEWMIKNCGAQLLDIETEYELFAIDFGTDIGECVYLKMMDSATHKKLYECVDHACRTVQQALNFRASRLRKLNGQDWKPEVLR